MNQPLRSFNRHASSTFFACPPHLFSVACSASLPFCPSPPPFFFILFCVLALLLHNSTLCNLHSNVQPKAVVKYHSTATDRCSRQRNSERHRCSSIHKSNIKEKKNQIEKALVTSTAATAPSRCARKQTTGLARRATNRTTKSRRKLPVQSKTNRQKKRRWKNQDKEQTKRDKRCTLV